MENKINCIEELFGTLQQSQIVTWRQHLKSCKNSEHEILRGYYEGISDLVDKLIEDYMGLFGKVQNYINILQEINCPVTYLTQVRDICKEGRYLLKGETGLESDLDDIMGFINGTLYKLKELVPKDDNPVSLSNFMKDKIAPTPDFPDLGCPEC